MTQNEIIEMAEQAGAVHYWHLSKLEAFAKLVAAKATDEANVRSNAAWALMCKKMVADERELCAKVCEAHSFRVRGFLDDDLLECKLVAASEREACANLVFNSVPSDEYESPLMAVYNAIRARGEA